MAITLIGAAIAGIVSAILFGALFAIVNKPLIREHQEILDQADAMFDRDHVDVFVTLKDKKLEIAINDIIIKNQLNDVNDYQDFAYNNASVQHIGKDGRPVIYADALYMVDQLKTIFAEEIQQLIRYSN